mmetsp:Transcript_2603/g.4026  ORF Transcript_2603/g.4026 Transcript_2603/m.4026 type:complete len:307 (+) Transcript_2603:1392-2312(+)
MISSGRLVELHLGQEERMVLGREELKALGRGEGLEFKDEGVLEGEEASFEEFEGLSELALEAEEVGEVEETLVMVEVLLQEAEQQADVHGRLHLLELLLQGFVAGGFLEAEDAGSVLLLAGYLHREEVSRGTRPVLLRLDEHELFLSHRTALLRGHLRVPRLVELALAATSAFKLGFHLVVDGGLPFFFLLLFSASELSGLLSEQLVELPLISEELAVHLKDGGLGPSDEPFLHEHLRVLFLELFALHLVLLDDLIEILECLLILDRGLLLLFTVVVALLLLLVLLFLLLLVWRCWRCRSERGDRY